jgi:hypothetical protein
MNSHFIQRGTAKMVCPADTRPCFSDDADINILSAPCKSAAQKNSVDLRFLATSPPLPQLSAILTVDADELNGKIETRKFPILPSVFTSKRHGRAILTEEQARQIFHYKPAPGLKDRTRAGCLSKMYGVSVKTIRDVWVGRTWYRVTCQLDQTKPLSPERLMKRAGRPKGTKDSKPRAKRPRNDTTESNPSTSQPSLHPIMTANVIEQDPVDANHFVPETRQADPEEAPQAESLALDPSVPIEPDIPGEPPAEQSHDPFRESWVGALWEQAADDLPSFFDTFDTFETFEFGQPSCAAL